MKFNIARSLPAQILLLAISLAFLPFGMRTLKLAFSMEDPILFFFTFFAANFLLLIAGAIAIGMLFRIRHTWKHRNDTPKMEDDQ